jgi:hypothetical protein
MMNKVVHEREEPVMKWRPLMIVTVLGAVAMCPAALPATAAERTLTVSGGFNGPTVSYPVEATRDYAAGVVCAFPMHVTFPVNRVKQLTWTSDAGTPVYATATGVLVMRVTNTANGRTVVRDISGNGTLAYPDPTSFVLSGNAFAAFLHSGDSPSGEALVIGWNGFAAVRAATVNGVTTRTVLTLTGPYENLCKTLAS